MEQKRQQQVTMTTYSWACAASITGKTIQRNAAHARVVRTTNEDAAVHAVEPVELTLTA